MSSNNAGESDGTGPALPTVWPGNAYPLGATYDGAGTNFSLFSEIAEKVELCLIDEDGVESRIPLDEVDGYVWHAYLPNITPGQRYGFRVHGPFDPAPAIGVTPASCCSTRMGSRSTAISPSGRRCIPMTSTPSTRTALPRWSTRWATL